MVKALVYSPPYGGGNLHPQGGRKPCMYNYRTLGSILKDVHFLTGEADGYL